MAETESETVLYKQFKLSELLQAKLEENHPEVLAFINTLQKFIEKQQIKIKKLRLKLQKRNALKDEETQTEGNSVDKAKNITEEIKEAAEMALQKTGFVYEKTSGLYYDYNTGYYYDAEMGLYYDGNTGTYMTYNAEKQMYEYHSQIELNTAANTSQGTRPKKPNTKRKKHHRSSKKVITSCDLENVSQLFSQININFHQHCKSWPPCMRIMVKSTALPNLKEGTLFIITCQGGTLGREGDHSILIPDINISKHHLKFTYNTEKNGFYEITDLGSRNGTLLNGKRISASKQESSPCEVTHGSMIQISSTTLLCHIHKGNETCIYCEPGLILNTDTSTEKVTISKNDQHKNELRLLRKKFGICQSFNGNTQLPAGYTDRAHVRRVTVGSHNDHEKTQVASVDESIGSENKGFKLLSKMGWSEGQSLGKDGSGLLKPVELASNLGTKGMGYNTSSVLMTVQSEGIWKKTQARYEELPSQSEDIFDIKD